MSVFRCHQCGDVNSTYMGYTCTTCGALANGAKVTYNQRKKQLLEQVEKDMASLDPHKRARSYNTECGGQTDFELVVGEGVYATRSWTRDGLGRLVSPTRHHVWKPGENVSDGHGFYAYTDNPTFEGEVKGVILASGKVTYGTRGCIAEKATIVAIYDPHNFSFAPLKNLRKLGAIIAHKYGSDRESSVGIIAHIATIIASTYSLVFGVVMAFGATTLLSTVLFGLLAAVGLVLAFSMIMTVGMTKANYQEWTGQTDGVYPLKELYPDVKFFSNKKKMLRKYGLPNNYTPPEPEIPKPTDEDFWTAKV